MAIPRKHRTPGFPEPFPSPVLDPLAAEFVPCGAGLGEGGGPGWEENGGLRGCENAGFVDVGILGPSRSNALQQGSYGPHGMDEMHQVGTVASQAIEDVPQRWPIVSKERLPISAYPVPEVLYQTPETVIQNPGLAYPQPPTQRPIIRHRDQQDPPPTTNIPQHAPASAIQPPTSAPRSISIIPRPSVQELHLYNRHAARAFLNRDDFSIVCEKTFFQSLPGRPPTTNPTEGTVQPAAPQHGWIARVMWPFPPPVPPAAVSPPLPSPTISAPVSPQRLPSPFAASPSTPAQAPPRPPSPAQNTTPAFAPLETQEPTPRNAPPAAPTPPEPLTEPPALYQHTHFFSLPSHTHLSQQQEAYADLAAKLTFCPRLCDVQITRQWREEVARRERGCERERRIRRWGRGVWGLLSDSDDDNDDDDDD